MRFIVCSLGLGTGVSNLGLRFRKYIYLRFSGASNGCPHSLRTFLERLRNLRSYVCVYFMIFGSLLGP